MTDSQNGRSQTTPTESPPPDISRNTVVSLAEFYEDFAKRVTGAEAAFYHDTAATLRALANERVYPPDLSQFSDLQLMEALATRKREFDDAYYAEKNRTGWGRG